MTTILETAYQKHHTGKRRGGFAILEKERGLLFKRLIGTGQRVLDLGCRDGVITKYFCEGNEVVGVDIDSVILLAAQKNLGISTLNFDIQSEQWPIVAQSFDVVVAGELLEHVYFPGEILHKINELLKPGGRCIGSVPNAFALKNRVKYLFGIKHGTPLADPMHINQFSRAELQELLKGNFTKHKLFPLGKKYLGLATYLPGWLGHSLAFMATK